MSEIVRQDFPVLHDYCLDCRKCRVAKKDGPKDERTGEPFFTAGQFIVPCNGIPKDYNYIPRFDKIQHILPVFLFFLIHLLSCSPSHGFLK